MPKNLHKRSLPQADIVSSDCPSSSVIPIENKAKKAKRPEGAVLSEASQLTFFTQENANLWDIKSNKFLLLDIDENIWHFCDCGNTCCLTDSARVNALSNDKDANYSIFPATPYRAIAQKQWQELFADIIAYNNNPSNPKIYVMFITDGLYNEEQFLDIFNHLYRVPDYNHENANALFVTGFPFLINRTSQVEIIIEQFSRESYEVNYIKQYPAATKIFAVDAVVKKYANVFQIKNFNENVIFVDDKYGLCRGVNTRGYQAVYHPTSKMSRPEHYQEESTPDSDIDIFSELKLKLNLSSTEAKPTLSEIC